jgi:hypothetical protein
LGSNPNGRAIDNQRLTLIYSSSLFLDPEGFSPIIPPSTMSNQNLEPVFVPLKDKDGEVVKNEDGTPKMVREPLLFINPSTGVYFLRKRVGKGDTTVSLRTTRLTEARKLREDYWAVIRAQKLGLVPTTPAPTETSPPQNSQAAGINPVLQPVAPATPKIKTEEPEREPDKSKPPLPFETVGEVLRFYAEKQYLTEDGLTRQPANIEDERRHCTWLLEFWNSVKLTEVSWKKMVEYKDFRCRKKRSQNGTTGHRAIDRQLITASNAMKFALLHERIELNPFVGRPKFRKNKDVVHCRSFMPQDAEELHDCLELLFDHPHTVPLGFQLALESYTGLRCEEITHWGTQNFGKVDPSRQYVYVWRVKGQHNDNPYCELNDGLKVTMAAFAAWKKVHYPKSKSYFPSHFGGGMHPDSLKRALLRIRPHLKRPLKSHGAGRAFFVLVQRSWGHNDEEIADMVGHTSGGASIRTSYGGVPRNWRNGKLPKLSWLPTKRKPAWELLPECAGTTRRILGKNWAKKASSAGRPNRARNIGDHQN